MEYHSYIKPELLILVPSLYCLGIVLKKSRLADNRIPAVLGLSGVGLSGIWVLATTHMSDIQDVFFALFMAVTQGILVAGAGVYAHQLYKQTTKHE